MKLSVDSRQVLHQHYKLTVWILMWIVSLSFRARPFPQTVHSKAFGAFELLLRLFLGVAPIDVVELCFVVWW